ncbi:6322_t:CDS:2 [Ambispora leptoticha]|uniref:6322_t:CDS:1 n=1 Tax=Ambispora leptoticha TaxID=144679 RepID=A0A9N9B378_9GLOM|nr:6322_t:CDS:2 [Ambispora leptoticha]
MADTELLAQKIFSVKGKVALVTGGGTGIGKMIAKGLVRNGARVYIASRKKENLDKVAAELSALGPGECIGIQANLTSKEECEKLVTEIRRRELDGKLHILVNNSGATWGAPLDKIPEKAWDRVNKLNVTGVYYLTIACLPLLEKASVKSRDPARVIIVGSVVGMIDGDIAGLVSVFGNTALPYNVSKAALHHMARGLAVYLTPRGITVNVIAPGVFPTPMNKHQDETICLSEIPFGRLGIESDMAGIALYLSSSASAYVSGAIIPVDGGLNLRPISQHSKI